MSVATNPTQVDSMVAILLDRAAAQPDHTAYHFIGDDTESEVRLSHAQLLQEAASLAVSLQLLQLAGKPVLLACRSNFYFVIAFHACLLSGALAVPTAPPRRQALEERIGTLAGHSGAAAVLTDSDAMLGMELDLPMMDVRQGRPSADDQPHQWTSKWPDVDQAALILYTSGTTGEPNGVVHSQRSLLAASRAVGKSFGHDDGHSAILLTLPLFHETGLMLGVIHPLEADVPVYLMTPAQFVKRPERWLRLIRQLDITTTGGPNFMFDILIRALDGIESAQFDLSCLRACFFTGEPVRAGTVARLLQLLQPFGLHPEAILPCYSLSEAGRHVTGSISGRAPVQLMAGLAGQVQPLVGCGKPHIDCRLLIVDPETRCVLDSGQIGEIWLQCGSIGLGYWNEPWLSKTVFNAPLGCGDDTFLRTADLGMMHDDELYVLGKIGDTVRLGSVDHAPHELELQAERSHAGLRPSCAAVFTVEKKRRARLVVACEFKRDMLRCPEKWPHIESAIRSAFRRVHQLIVDDVVLLEPGALPKTSSGKVRRGHCRDAYLAGQLTPAGAVAHGLDPGGEPGRVNKH